MTQVNIIKETKVLARNANFILLAIKEKTRLLAMIALLLVQSFLHTLIHNVILSLGTSKASDTVKLIL